MRLDSHQHFWSYDAADYPWMNGPFAPLARDYLPDDLQCHLNQNDLDGSILVQVRQSLEENRWMLALADEHPSIRGVGGWVDLCAGDVAEQLEPFLGHRAFKGVRHIVQDEPDDGYLLREDFQRGIGELAGLGLRYDILVYPKQLPAAVAFARAFPEQPFVLDHIAKPLVKDGAIEPWGPHLKELASCHNVTCKVSGLITEADWNGWSEQQFDRYLDVVLEAFGPNRLMYGSDWPVCTLAGSYEQVFSLGERFAARLSDAERAGFWGGNAAAFYDAG